jgi:hypothetical protein
MKKVKCFDAMVATGTGISSSLYAETLVVVDLWFIEKQMEKKNVGLSRRHKL